LQLTLIDELIHNFTNKIPEFTGININKECSMLLYEKSKKGNEIQNEELYKLLRVAVFGQANALMGNGIPRPPVGEVCEVIGL
jgi:hypothetical protein